MIITRFSPSPTGYIHVGNVRTAIVNYLFTKKHNGKMILRMDDTDPKRSKAEYTDAIIADLKWLGLNWDEFYKQSDKLTYYTKVRDKLIKDGFIYPCFETEEELGLKRKTQLQRGVPPIYDREALNLSKSEIEQKISNGEKPYFRFKLDDKKISWHDGVKGEISFKERAFSDPVVFRADNSPTYTFCSVIDDIELNITDIIRGEDHISNTAVQIQIFRSLTDKLPNFHHLSLLKTKETEISKRDGGFDVRSLKNQGVDAAAITSLLARIGTSDNVEALTDYKDLIAEFDISKFSQSAIIYNEKDLVNLNRKILAKRNFSEVKNILTDLNIDISENFWLSIRENINDYSEIEVWQKIFQSNFNTEIIAADKEFLSLAANFLPEDLNVDEFKLWIKRLSKQTGRKGKELYHPIRTAITGQDSGPELSKIIPLLGYEEVKKRLNG
ncbi:MAG: glutamate--tRNA ligase [Alphaproteobacteria bacterium]|jgi:glutamyl-tRNA synthetase|nr:glutamate--tRNA ligase [Alphaproteobacteria bacterium]